MNEREGEDVNLKVIDAILSGNLSSVKNLFETKKVDMDV
jgi:hypothetical protein